MIDQRIGKIKVRRGTDSQRTTNVFEEGEVVYSVDKKRIFVGDDVTLGGVPVSNRNYIVNSLGNPPIIPNGVLAGDIIYDKSDSKTYIVHSNLNVLELLLIADGISSNNLKDQISDIYTKLRTLTSCLTPPPPPPKPPSKLSWVVQPSNFSINVGDSVTFSSSAVGDGNISYVWKRKDALIINTSNIFQKTITISNAGIPDIATYYCIASNSIDSITSRDAVLSIGSNSILAEDGTYITSEVNEFIDWEYKVTAPIITKQPVSITTNAGTSVTFSVEAMGTDPLSYQWRVGGVNVAGENKNTYTITNPTVDINSITCKVSNPGGDIISDSVNLILQTFDVITWSSVAMSSDGTKQIAITRDSRIYTSIDSGDTWIGKKVKFGGLLPWSIAISSDGTKQTVVVFSGQIYISSDSGNTWTAKESNRRWFSVAMSSDGTKQTAVPSELSDYIYISTDSGNTWIGKQSGNAWHSVAMSSDGTKQTALGHNDGQIYISSDSGNTWTAKESNRKWFAVAMSSDGTKQTAVVEDGQIYISSDSGDTWTAKESNRKWRSVAMSSDGTKQTAVVDDGQIYVSTDSGNTWTAKESDRKWIDVAMSSDGTKQTAVVLNGQIYVSTDSGNTWIKKPAKYVW